MTPWRSQVELYLYFLQGQGIVSTGELVVISVVDGYQHRLPVPHNPEQKSYVERQLRWLITEREKRLLHGTVPVSRLYLKACHLLTIRGEWVKRI